METKTGVAMELFLDPTPPAAGSARRALHSAAMFGAATEPDALLLVSELVTNSILHAGHSTGGRGLLLVDALSHRWGMDTCERGTCVWFEIRA